MTSSTDLDLDALVQVRAEHQAAAEAAAQQIAEREAAIMAAQMARREEWDSEFVESYSARLAALEQEERAAKTAFYDTVVADPVVQAWVTMRACRWRRSALISQMGGALVRLGNERDAARYSPPDFRDPRLFEEMLGIAEDEAHRVAVDEDTELVDARERYAMEGER